MNHREVIRNNRKKTYIVLSIYLVIYTFIGLLLDVVFQAIPEVSLKDMLYKLITFQIIPFATISMLLIGIISIFYSIKKFDRILLEGDEYLEITEEVYSKTDNIQIKKLYNSVSEISISAGMQYMPKVYLVKVPYMNAFASGWREENSLVAVTQGLLDKLNDEELDAVVAHEISHIKNEDIKLTLVVGVTTNIMLFIVNVMAHTFIRGNSKAANQAKIILLILNFILPFATILLQFYLSRKREYMADRGSVSYYGNPDALISALQKISGDYEENNSFYKKYEHNKSRQEAYIFPINIKSWFSTHPSIESRVSTLLNRKKLKESKN